MTAEEEIESWYKDAYRELQKLHGRYGVPYEDASTLNEQYKQRHNLLILERIAAEKREEQERRAAETRICELCGNTLPIKRGRAPKRCEECK